VKPGGRTVTNAAFTIGQPICLVKEDFPAFLNEHDSCEVSARDVLLDIPIHISRNGFALCHEADSTEANDSKTEPFSETHEV
jgi:hypothetical protein